MGRMKKTDNLKDEKKRPLAIKTDNKKTINGVPARANLEWYVNNGYIKTYHIKMKDGVADDSELMNLDFRDASKWTIYRVGTDGCHIVGPYTILTCIIPHEELYVKYEEDEEQDKEEKDSSDEEDSDEEDNVKQITIKNKRKSGITHISQHALYEEKGFQHRDYLVICTLDNSPKLRTYRFRDRVIFSSLSTAINEGYAGEFLPHGFDRKLSGTRRSPYEYIKFPTTIGMKRVMDYHARKVPTNKMPSEFISVEQIMELNKQGLFKREEIQNKLKQEKKEKKEENAEDSQDEHIKDNDQDEDSQDEDNQEQEEEYEKVSLIDEDHPSRRLETKKRKNISKKEEQSRKSAKKMTKSTSSAKSSASSSPVVASLSNASIESAGKKDLVSPQEDDNNVPTQKKTMSRAEMNVEQQKINELLIKSGIDLPKSEKFKLALSILNNGHTLTSLMENPQVARKFITNPKHLGMAYAYYMSNTNPSS